MAVEIDSAPIAWHINGINSTDRRNCIKVYSFNMHGFSNSCSYLEDLCDDNDLIFIQKHWFMTQHLTKFDDISSNFIFKMS